MTDRMTDEELGAIEARLENIPAFPTSQQLTHACQDVTCLLAEIRALREELAEARKSAGAIAAQACMGTGAPQSGDTIPATVKFLGRDKPRLPETEEDAY